MRLAWLEEEIVEFGGQHNGATASTPALRCRRRATAPRASSRRAAGRVASGRLGGLTCGEWAERWLARYERDRKDSSYDTARSALTAFTKDFGDRPIRDISRLEAIDWAERVAAHRLPVVVTLFSAAVDAELLERNPFRGLSRRTRGRSDQHPPTLEELDRLIVGCSALGWYAPQMRALLTFAAYSGMRPGELFALEWTDVDFDAMRVHVNRRVYRGRVDLPKSNKVRTIALTPPARDALLGQPADGRLRRHWGAVLQVARRVDTARVP